MTLSGATPLLVSVTSRSFDAPTQTSPKSPLSTTEVVMIGAPPMPDTWTTRGPPVTLVEMVRFADFGPVPVGWNRMGTFTEVPGATVKGNDTTCAIRKSGALDVMPVTVSGQPPGLAITSG